jgi:nitrite reductase/ring-hydroxylating ferredoxin subunit
LTVSSGSAFASAIEDLTIPVAAGSPLAKIGGSQIVDSSAGKLIVIHVADSKYAALSAVCTHKRGVLEYNGKQLVCPKHGSKFDTSDGSVASGPAENPIKSYPAKAGDGSVTVAVS